MHRYTYSGAMAFLLMALLLMGALVGPAWADEAPAEEAAVQEARALADAARERHAAGDGQGALRLYRQAYRLHPTPYLFWPQAELLLELGQPVEGLAALRSHQAAFAPDDLPAGQGPAEIQALEEKLNAKIGRLMVLTDRPGAILFVNGVELPQRTPLSEPLRVNPGPQEVEARGARTARQRVTVAPGQEVMLTLVVRPPDPPPPPPPMPDRRRLLRGLGYGALGGAGVFLLSGVIATGLREVYVDRWNSDECLVNGQTRAMNCANHQTSYQHAQSAAIAGYVLAGAFAAAGIGLLSYGRPRERRLAQAVFSCGPGPGAVGLSCMGLF